MSALQTIKELEKARFEQTKGIVVNALETTPDERINWSPSSTARTPIQLVAHVAWAVKSMLGNLTGDTYPVPTTQEANQQQREWEKQFSTRDEVLKLLDQNSSEYLAWLEDLTQEQLDSQVEMPFGMGAVPMEFAISFMPLHVHVHAAQLDYVQTIYGDQDWHI